MPHIVLTEEQARKVAGASQPVQVRDVEGRIVGFLIPFEPPEVEAILRLRRRRASPSPEPGIPAARVHTMLLRLEEIDQQEGITREKVEEILRKVRAGEEP